MAFDAHANLATSTVLTAPSPALSGITLVVAAGQGARFPTPPFNATVCPAGTRPTPANAEIVRVTAIVTDTFTITRAQESSVARAIIVGDVIEATITKKTITDLEAGTNFAALTCTGTLTAGAATISGVVLVASAGSTFATGAGQFGAGLAVPASTHATSRRASLTLGSGQIGQDLFANGTLDMYLVNASAKGVLIAATTGIITLNAYGAGTATFNASGVISSVSDERLKQVLGRVPYGLAHVRKLKPILYRWTPASGLDDPKHTTYAGFGARQVRRVMPIAIGTNADGTLALQDRAILAALVNAAQELADRLDHLEEHAA